MSGANTLRRIICEDTRCAPGMEVCTKCHVKKPLSDFHKCVSHKSGVASKCKTCTSEARKKDSPRAVRRRQIQELQQTAPVGYKVCSKCFVSKPLRDFSPNTATISGVASYCKKCVNVAARKSRSDSPRAQRLRHINIVRGTLDIPEGSSFCTICERVKPIDAFHINAVGKPNSHCIECHLWNSRKRNRQRHVVRKENGYITTCVPNLRVVRADVYSALQREQGGCAICGTIECSQHGTRLSLDHDHTTGLPRGFLCARCNNAIGQLGDDPDIVKALLQYVLNVTRKSHLYRMRTSMPTYRARRMYLRNNGAVKRAYLNWLDSLGGERCQVTGSTERVCIDHDHRCGTVRGLLSLQANNALGRFRERTDLMHAAIKYLETTSDADHQQRLFDRLSVGVQ